METGDYLMILERDKFGYIGQVLHRVSVTCYEVSKHIWDDEGFPLIVFLEGGLIAYPWERFRDHFAFPKTYHMQGNTMSLASSRIDNSPSGSEEVFIASLLLDRAPMPEHEFSDFQPVSEIVQARLRLVKERGLQKRFRHQVLEKQGDCCAVCDLPYTAALDAAHIVPKDRSGRDDHRNEIILCATHHRMFDLGIFKIHPDTLAVHPIEGLTRAKLRITRDTIRHLRNGPHKAALKWHWDNEPWGQAFIADPEG
jgi:hypothetical protein